MFPNLVDKGGRPITPRAWQQRAFDISAAMLMNGQQSALLNVCPGGGKTLLGIALARFAIDNNQVDRVIVVAPRSSIRDQWANQLQLNGIPARAHIPRADAIARDGLTPNEVGLALTYGHLADEIVKEFVRRVCSQHRVLVIMDEIHWNDEQNHWGSSLMYATAMAKFGLCLSGTPFRDVGKIPFIRYQNQATVEADFNLFYGEALKDGIVAPISFYSKNGVIRYNVKDEAGNVLLVEEQDFDDEYYTDSGEDDETRLGSRLRAALDVGSPWWKDLMRDAHQRLMEIRASNRKTAGGIVFAKSQPEARAIAAFLQEELVHDPVPIISSDESDDIDGFAYSTKPWVVSVRMITEGIDIERLAVCAYLTNVARSQKAFIQSVSRIVRLDRSVTDSNFGQPVYVFMPNDQRLRKWARQFEEAVAAAMTEGRQPECPECHAPGERPRVGHPCSVCGYEPQEGPPPPKRIYEVVDVTTGTAGVVIDGEFVSREQLAAQIAMTNALAKNNRDIMGLFDGMTGSLGYSKEHASHIIDVIGREAVRRAGL